MLSMLSHNRLDVKVTCRPAIDGTRMTTSIAGSFNSRHESSVSATLRAGTAARFSFDDSFAGFVDSPAVMDVPNA